MDGKDKSSRPDGRLCGQSGGPQETGISRMTCGRRPPSSFLTILPINSQHGSHSTFPRRRKPQNHRQPGRDHYRFAHSPSSVSNPILRRRSSASVPADPSRPLRPAGASSAYKMAFWSAGLHENGWNLKRPRRPIAAAALTLPVVLPMGRPWAPDRAPASTGSDGIAWRP